MSEGGTVTRMGASCTHRKSGACGECFAKLAMSSLNNIERGQLARRGCAIALDWLLNMPLRSRPDGTDVVIDTLNKVIRGTEQDQSKEGK